ncbi:MAG: DUF3124 domain-containing protein [Acidobacteria bacterium]|nr:DUF3124 domain-containing protein [Acidobacteriota bacterium]
MRPAAAMWILLLLCWGCDDPPAGDPIFHPAGQKALRPATSDPAMLAVKGETYVPVYSNIYWGRTDSVTELSATLSVRNADQKRPLTLTRVDYYDSRGKLIRQYLDAPVELEAMGTVEWVIEQRDTEGGSGANFVVGWGAPGAVAKPVMESIMLGHIGSFGISFVSEGRPIEVAEPAATPAPAE